MDEGYSEDTRSQPDAESAPRADELEACSNNALLPQWILSLGEAERSVLAYAILRSLRTSSIAHIVDRVNPLLHLDPVRHLPPEIVLAILSNLAPVELLTVSTLSKGWHLRALDVQLWRDLFRAEGWRYNARQVREFESRAVAAEVEAREKHARVRRAEADAGRQSTKRRAQERSVRSGAEEEIPFGWVEQHGVVEADDHSPNGDVDRMEGVSFQHERGAEASASTGGERARNPRKTARFVTRDERGRPQLDWHYIYRQKRRLESNWTHGRFTNFVLPHPNHPEESHNECVYTIQYSDRYLVSGSRDKTVRIWDLETQRLARPPLTGHQASVLCLQFDEKPQEDVIISGGSDCHVKIWRFSDGACIHTINRAHREPVLNLRFDSRYLVTCSKDRTVKVWNRRNLSPTSPNFPRPTPSQSATFAERVINVAAEYERQQLHQLAYSGPPVLKPYELIVTLHGHTAAVNAIQIREGEIVSASGDRTVKIWDVLTGKCLITILGHVKGIACVQFDGRRIVSGSSDETVRIFDRATGAEVACLKGHTNLVRTLQARFGDLPGTEEDLEAEARTIDLEYLSARDAGRLAEPSREALRARNAGSRDPARIFAIGAKLPPGGGGSRWARIVSGSYDETVIVWRRNAEGEWVVAHQLSQSRAVVSAGGSNGVRQRQLAAAAAAAAQQAQQAHLQNAQNAGQASAAANQAQGPAATAQTSPTTPQLPGSGQAQTPAAQPPTHLAVGAPAPGASPHGSISPSPSPAPPTAAIAPTPGPSGSPSPAQPPPPTAQTVALPHPGPTSTPAPPLPAPTHPLTAVPPTPPGGPQTLTPAQQQMLQHPQQHIAHQHQHHAVPPAAGHPHHHHLPAGAAAAAAAAAAAMAPSNARVFKLQFDSRRIICCSQDPTIVGWDFANGDEEIMAVSRFFAEDG